MRKITPNYLEKRFPISKIRNKSTIFIPRPRTNLFMTSFTYSGGKLWNDLNDSFKKIGSVSSFKRAYNKHLIDKLWAQLTFFLWNIYECDYSVKENITFIQLDWGKLPSPLFFIVIANIVVVNIMHAHEILCLHTH